MSRGTLGHGSEAPDGEVAAVEQNSGTSARRGLADRVGVEGTSHSFPEVRNFRFGHRRRRSSFGIIPESASTNTFAGATEPRWSAFSRPKAVQACYFVLRSWISKKFMTGCVVLFSVASPLYPARDKHIWYTVNLVVFFIDEKLPGCITLELL
ncbi:hypothetical protein NL676_038645 [Syzygium grande]|nr:hypothetical protein NL676_038645 [Syzygium grande]